jgi:phosphate transport system protein
MSRKSGAAVDEAMTSSRKPYVEHTVKAYAEELAALQHEVARMGGLVESAFNESLQAIVRRDTMLAQAVIGRDTKIDEAQRDIEKRAVRLFALRQPMANDLRVVLTCWRTASDLERIGDLAKNIAKRALILNLAEPVQLTRSVERMGKLAAAHLKQVLDAFSSQNVDIAVGVWFQDEGIDTFYNSLFRELLTYMMEDPRTIGACAHLLFVAKNIERVGDHCTNIAEHIHYLVTGEEIATERPKADENSAEA